MAIISLALGIGANTSIFSVVNALLLKPLPYKNPDQLAQVFREYEQTGKGVERSEIWSYPKFSALRDNNDSFAQIAAVSSQNFPVTDSDNPERLSTEIVSASYFPMLGVEAAIGRTFTAEEDQTPGAHPVAVIGHGVWQRRCRLRPQRDRTNHCPEQGRVNHRRGLARRISGRAGTAEVWVPMMMAPQLTFTRRLATAFAHWTEVIEAEARCKPRPGAERNGDCRREGRRSCADALYQLAGKLPFESIRPTSLKEAKLGPGHWEIVSGVVRRSRVRIADRVRKRCQPSLGRSACPVKRS